MVGAFVTFVLLYGLLYGLERARTDVDAFSIATVAGAPVLSAVLVAIILGFLYPNPLALAFAPLLVLLVMTFLLLAKFMGLPTGRAVGYTAVVLLVNIGLSFALSGG